MAVSNTYLAFVLEQLDGLRGVVPRRMFGGVGIYADGTFFAVIDNDTVFFKVDDALAERYRARGMPPFAPIPGAKPMTGYYQVPPEVLEDGALLTTWARDSIRAVDTAPVKKGTRRERARPRRRAGPNPTATPRRRRRR